MGPHENADRKIYSLDKNDDKPSNWGVSYFRQTYMIKYQTNVNGMYGIRLHITVDVIMGYFLSKVSLEYTFINGKKIMMQ